MLVGYADARADSGIPGSATNECRVADHHDRLPTHFECHWHNIVHFKTKQAAKGWENVIRYIFLALGAAFVISVKTDDKSLDA